MASTGTVKEECFCPLPYPVKAEQAVLHTAVVEISSSSSSGDRDQRGYGDLPNAAAEVTSPPVSKRPNSLDNQITNGFGPAAKRPRIEANGHPGPACSPLPDDFLQPLEEIQPRCLAPQPAMVSSRPILHPSTPKAPSKVFRQFWKAGDYESDKAEHKAKSGGMDHVRVHPKFLHSNATSHKWALGAVAELLDNALDEVVHGATFVRVDMIGNPKNGEPMLLVEDDGGGMNPDNMRQCMSLGYSVKSKVANTIGQYGNGFKTSTMRLGADVIVFSRCRDSKGLGPTESVGMLSYTFLRETGQEDIIVPMIDYEIKPFGLRKLIRSNVEDWNRNMESLKRWSPYATEAELLDHFKGMKDQGTKIIVFNLWEDDQGQLELDFVTNRHDIQVRGANRDEKQISMAERFPNSRHYLTYQHSLRSYASILYLRLPPGFRMFLRGKEIEHHNLIDDLMFTEIWNYRPVGSDVQRDTGQMKAVVTVGFVKDAKDHIDVQGFNVYHKNRLIKPFWRLWNSAASRGRGIIGVLEANFVEPAHDKQGFERTIVLARLEARLLEMQKTYWSKHCHKVGYVNNTLKGKDGKAAEQKEASSSVDTVHPAPVVARSMPLPIIPEPPRLPVQGGYLSGVHAPSNVARPAGLARSMQLQTQIQLARHEHGVHEVHPQALRQVGPQALPMSVSIPSQRPRDPTVNQNEIQTPVIPSSLQTMNSQPRGQFYNATRSPLPSPVSSSSRMPHLQPESARRVTPSPGPSLISPMRPQVSQALPTISQPLPTNHVSPAVRSMTTNSNSSVALQNGVHDPSIRSSTVTGNVRSQPPGSGVEAVRTAAARARFVDQSHRSQGMAGANSQEIQNFTFSPEADLLLSTRHGRDSGQICEDSVSLQGGERNIGPTRIEQVQVQVDGDFGGCNEQNGQGLSNAGTASRSAVVESVGAEAPQRQPVVRKSLEGSESSSFRLAGDAVENCRVESTCAPILTPSSNLPNAVPIFNPNVSRAAHIQPEQSLLRAPKLSNKDSVLGRKSLEDLGRMFARKAASITMNQGEQANKGKDHDAEAIVPIATDDCPTTNKELEVHLVEMELEVGKLQQRLETLKVERDNLRHQLLEERLQGQLNKQELQKKVDQTWAKVRELEAQNERLRLAKR